MVSNGSTLPCKGKCCSVCISIGDYNLRSNMFSMPLGGCDVILGTQWLHTLGPILWDFVELWMHFLVTGKKHTFMAYNQGLSASSVHITWKISLRRVHMVSLLSSISFRCNLRQSQILPWIFHSDAPFRCLIFPSPSLLQVMLATMDLVLSSFKMNIPWNSLVNPFLEIIYPPPHVRRK